MMVNTHTTRHARRRRRGAAMIETVFILPFIMLVVVLIIYVGWNFRRLAQTTNMDRYSVWETVTPGAPGPDAQHLAQEMRNPQLNNAFFGLTGDQALTLNERERNNNNNNNDNRNSFNNNYTPQGHEDLRDRQADETYSYFDEFIERNPRGTYQRFEATHEQIADLMDNVGMSNLTRNSEGHSRMNGDWRYVNGVRPRRGEWGPGGYRVTPGSSLREVFFVELDEGLEPYDDSGNHLAEAIREFYLSYPGYRGPDVVNDSRGRSGLGRNRGGPQQGF